MLKYLGKSKLHEFLKENGFNPPMLKTMAYGKYRGDEWLKNDILDVSCIRGKIMFVSELEYNEEKDKFIEISKYRYDLVDGEWKKNYECHRGERAKIYDLNLGDEE